MQTRRYPRTMQEAFGPYTSDQLEPMRETRSVPPLGDWVLAVSLATALALFLVKFCPLP